MATVETELPLMQAGDRMTRDEFLRCWEAMPNVKFAELIGGTVYMPTALSAEHGDMDLQISTWVGVYAALTPGCRGGANAAWLMVDDAPQPDSHLRILPEYGGQSGIQGLYSSGALEFLAEVSLSSRSYDLHQKLELYQEADVREYLAVLLREREVRWHQRVGKVFEVRSPGPDGVYRSEVFPGLWLDGTALLACDMARVLAVLNQGLASAEHARFIEQLRRQQQRP